MPGSVPPGSVRALIPAFLIQAGVRRAGRLAGQPLAALVLAMAFLALAAPGASATTIKTEPAGLSIFGQDEGDESEEVRVYIRADNQAQLGVQVIDNSYELSGCVMDQFTPVPVLTGQSARCPRFSSEPGGRINVSLRDEDDGFAGSDLEGNHLVLSDPVSANGGGGPDLLEGGSANDDLHGGSGKDKLTGGLGEDSLLGDSGDDQLRGDYPTHPVGDRAFVDRDTMNGGIGRDKVRYSDRHVPVLISLDGIANDGQRGGEEADNLISIEDATGGTGDDTITGNGAKNTLSGTGGKDLIKGFGNDDNISGGGGDDSVRGGDDDDEVDGGIGDDTVTGGAGDDRLTGGTGKDRFVAGSGKDRVYAKDGRKERVNCGGGGSDFARVDPFDIVTACEDVAGA